MFPNDEDSMNIDNPPVHPESFDDTPEGTPAPQPQQPVENAAPQKKSPYADSPYVHYAPPRPAVPRYSQGIPYQPPVRKEKNGRPFWSCAISAILTIALVAGGCAVTAYTVNKKWEDQNSQTVADLNRKITDLQQKIDSGSASFSGQTVASGDLMTPGQVYAQNVDSVVAISSTVRTSVYGRITEGTSSGSGFILTENGFVATNYHVIQDATEITVITHGNDKYPAKVVGSDSTIDLAVLKIEAENLPAVTLGSSTDLAIGDMVVAIGNPLGQLTATQTVGYVSGKNREVTTDNTVISMIQTDAAINPGNSGGPLFNMRGEVVGITSAKYSGTTSGGASIEGIGFAIPMDDIASIITDLKDLGYVTGAYLGVTVQNTDAESAALFGLPTGAYVVSVVEGGSADNAGIQPKDIIISLGDETVENVAGLTRALRHFKAGDTTVLTVIRSGQRVDLEITLDEKPHDPEQPESGIQDDQMPEEGNYDEWFDYFRRFFEEYGG